MHAKLRDSDLPESAFSTVNAYWDDVKYKKLPILRALSKAFFCKPSQYPITCTEKSIFWKGFLRKELS